MAQRSPKLFVISGPSGVGKGTLVAQLRSRRSSLGLTVSATTRSPRAGEQDGVDYYFLSDEEFDKHIAAHEFVEWAVVHGHRYGTLIREVRACLARGESVILEIDVQGALQVRKVYPNAILIFIEPPSLEELERRLRGRQTDDDAAIAERLSNALQELALADRYHARVVNDNLEIAINDLEALIDHYETDGGINNVCNQS